MTPYSKKDEQKKSTNATRGGNDQTQNSLNGCLCHRIWAFRESFFVFCETKLLVLTQHIPKWRKMYKSIWHNNLFERKQIKVNFPNYICYRGADQFIPSFIKQLLERRIPQGLLLFLLQHCNLTTNLLMPCYMHAGTHICLWILAEYVKNEKEH